MCAFLNQFHNYWGQFFSSESRLYEHPLVDLSYIIHGSTCVVICTCIGMQHNSFIVLSYLPFYPPLHSLLLCVSLRTLPSFPLTFFLPPPHFFPPPPSLQYIRALSVSEWWRVPQTTRVKGPMPLSCRLYRRSVRETHQQQSVLFTNALC